MRCSKQANAAQNMRQHNHCMYRMYACIYICRHYTKTKHNTHHLNIGRIMHCCSSRMPTGIQRLCVLFTCKIWVFWVSSFRWRVSSFKHEFGFSLNLTLPIIMRPVPMATTTPTTTTMTTTMTRTCSAETTFTHFNGFPHGTHQSTFIGVRAVVQCPSARAAPAPQALHDNTPQRRRCRRCRRCCACRRNIIHAISRAGRARGALCKSVQVPSVRINTQVS